MTTVDVHTHLAPVLDDDTVVRPADLCRPEALEAHLDSAGLDLAIVSVPPPYFAQHLDDGASTRWAATVNEGLLARIAGRPRLRGLAYLPLHRPDAALAEYRRVRGSVDWLGVVGAAGGTTPSLAHPAFAPLWTALASDGRTLLLHPAASPDRRLDDFYLSNLLGNPVETAVAVAQLVFGDVLGRYPAMRVVLVHGGGVVPAVAGRWARGVDTSRPGITPLELAPRDAVRRLWVDCLTHDAAALDLAVATFGEDRVVVGSDWPFPMGSASPQATLAHRGPEFVARAASVNAAAAFGLDPPVS